MKILLLGSGGREHALAWKLAQSPRTEKLYIAPGNGGTGDVAENVDLDVSDFDGIASFVINYEVDMVVVGPEVPLVEGIADYFKGHSLLKDVLFVGPSKAGAQLEGSKDFAKQFMLRHHIPTAAYQTFSAGELGAAERFLETLQPPYVLKADGLAAGKGVLISPTLEDARRDLHELLGGKFGEAGAKVVIEEFLHGIECSVFILTDGTHYKLLPEAKDYKRIGEGDTGPNTGGMGSVSPVPFATPEWMQRVEERIVRPTVEGLAAEGIDYRGFIFFGLMIDYDGNPKVIEYNVRLGDPETESLMPRLKTDLVELLHASAVGRLGEMPVEFVPDVAATVILVSAGYPGAYRKGLPIIGLDTEMENVVVFHAGTKADDGRVVTSGGRVLAVTALAPTLPDALTMAYRRAGQIRFEGVAYRRDIGSDIDDPYANRTPDFVRRAKNQATLYTADYNTKHNRN